MDLKTVMLGFLFRGDLTGYEIKQSMDESVGFFFGASYGAIYPALKALGADGLVEVREVIQSGRPNKKVYSLTPAGAEYFRARLGEPPAGDSFRSEFLIQLFFGEHQDGERLVGRIREYREDQRRKLEVLRQVEREVKDAASPYEMMCLRYGLISFEAHLSWAEEVEEQARKLAEKQQTDEREAKREA